MRLFLTSVFILLATYSFAQINPVNLKCEYITNPEGIDIPHPRFSWQLSSNENNQFQSAYQIFGGHHKRETG